MKKYIFALSFVATLLPAQTLTMQECIDKTLQTHPDIKSFTLEISKSEQGYISARSALLPHLDLQAEYDPQRTYVMPKNGELSTLNQSNLQVGISLQQKVFDFYKTSSLIDSAKVDQEMAKLSSQEAKNLMIYKVETLYETALIQKEAIEVRKKDLQTKEELYKQSLAFVEQGLKTTSDSTRFLSALYAAQDALSKAEAEFQKTVTTLSLYTSQNISFDAEFEKSISINKSQTAELTLKNNTELQIYDKAIEKNKFQTQALKAQHYGSIDLVAGYNHFDNINAYDTHFVGLTLNIPLFSGFDTSAKEQMSVLSTSIAREAKSSKNLLLQEEFGKLLIDKKQYAKTIEAKQAQLEASQSTKNLLQARYKEGLATYIELLDVTTLYLTSALELLEAKYNLSLIQYKIIYLTGAKQ